MSEQLRVHSFRRLRGGFTYNHKAITFAQDDGACRIGDNLVEDDISLRQAGGEGCPRGQVSFFLQALKKQIGESHEGLNIFKAVLLSSGIE